MTPTAHQYARFNAPRALSLWLLLGFLGGCVTETTGGFQTDRSDDQALADYLQLATRYLDSGDLPNAKRHLNNASAIAPSNGDVAAIWGLVYSREGEGRLADESFRRALRLDAANSQARNNYAAFLFAEGRHQDAFDQLERVVQDTDYPARAQAFENLGLAALRLGRTEDADRAFNRALQLNDRMLRASLELTDLNLDKGAVLPARNYYRNYLTLLQLYDLGHNARSLWLGIRLENALGNTDNVHEYGDLLEASFEASAEYQLYLQLLDTMTDD